MSLELGGAKYQKEEDELELSKFIIINKLGSGAYSVVWFAINQLFYFLVLICAYFQVC
jgi:hypothetical protein